MSKTWVYAWDGRPWDGSEPETKQKSATVCPDEKIILSSEEIIGDQCKYCGANIERIEKKGESMQKTKLIRVKYFGPSNFRGSRIKLIDELDVQYIYIPYDHRFNNTLDIALDYLEKAGADIVTYSELEDGYAICVKFPFKLKGGK